MKLSTIPDPVSRLARRLGHDFSDPGLLLQACTHRSCGPPHNERLEFLGDGLLNFTIGRALYRLRPSADEGALSRLRASLVCEDTLAKLARELDLGEALQLGSGELRSGGFRRASILADTVEALLGAIYLDAGFETASAVCLRLYHALLENLPDAASLKDAKTRLQEVLQSDGRPLPQYEVLDASGPAHRRRFHVRCSLGATDQRSTEAVNSSRKQAEQDAAAAMLAQLEQPHA